MEPLWHLDKPDVTRAPTDPARFEFKAWVAVDTPVSRIEFVDPVWARALPLTFTARPDVEQRYQVPATGFESSCPRDLLPASGVGIVRFTTAGRDFEMVVPLWHEAADPKTRKTRKLMRLVPFLKCPFCGCDRVVRLEKPPEPVIRMIQPCPDHAPDGFDRGLLSGISHPVGARFVEWLRHRVLQPLGKPPPKNDYLVCTGCHHTITLNGLHYNFLTDSFKDTFSIVPTENVSANLYDGVAMNMVHRLRDGLILDCGAGRREKYYEHVVNYEIVPYESTDVLGVAESLPFRDNTFDAVFSFAVLEHVKDPFVAARELARVLKPGGHIFCVAPFLQPVHSYPHHYYNMTQRGLSRLFEGLVRVDQLAVLNFGQPVFTLTWFLNDYLNGLPEGLRASFQDLRVRDLLLPGHDYLNKPYVTRLAPDTQAILANSNYLIGTKL